MRLRGREQGNGEIGREISGSWRVCGGLDRGGLGRDLRAFVWRLWPSRGIDFVRRTVDSLLSTQWLD